MASIDQIHLRDQVSELIQEVSNTLIMPRFRSLRDDDISTKSAPNDIVTIADIEAEAWLAPRLLDLLPGSAVVGEEAVSRGEASTDLMASNDLVWTLDPVDGTLNFAKGNEDFCCMVALCHQQSVLAAWIYFPTSRKLFWASQGNGTWRKCVGKEYEQIKTSKVNSTAAITNRFFSRPDLKEKREHILDELSPTQKTQCAGHDYCRAALGTYAFVAMAKLMPWDHAPGTLLVKEAGGQVWLNKSTYCPTVLSGTLISGSDLKRMELAAALLGSES